MISALLGALSNLGVTWDGNSLLSLLTFRFFTGFFLAGIYPVGMKIAADYFDIGLGKSLGYLVGALVIGTAFPHLLKDVADAFPWKYVLYATSSLAVLGGTLMFLLVPNGPYRKESQKTDLSAFLDVFKSRQFRSVAIGYFGHMWELYAFWTFVPIILATYTKSNPAADINISLVSFLIIAIGGLACMLAGYFSQAKGAKNTAFYALLFSCLCCLRSPLIFQSSNEVLFLSFLFFWAAAVIADSPLFSTLVAQNAIAEMKGTALTIVNCLGYTITIISIQLLSLLLVYTDSTAIYAVLALGPIIGLFSLSKYKSIA
jgi:MFS family permease